MKRIGAIFLTLVIVLSIPFSAFAADKQTAAQNNAAVAQEAAKLEKKYGIKIKYGEDKDGYATITENTLATIDMALENVTPNVVKQVSDYYKKQNGTALTLSYVQKTSNLTAGAQATLGQFTKSKSLIEMYIPASSSTVIITGESPIAIVHEFGHTLHLMYADRVGADKVKKEWTALNGGSTYSEANAAQNPKETTFVSAYGATMYEEDVAEVFAHAFVRNRKGQGFKNKLTNKSGEKTALGKKVDYVEKMIASLDDSDDAVANFRRIHETSTSMTYQKLKLSGEYMQFAGYPQPRFILNGTLKTLGKTKQNAVWIRSIGGWYVEEKDGNKIIVFPGGTWANVGKSFEPPSSKAA